MNDHDFNDLEGRLRRMGTRAVPAPGHNTVEAIERGVMVADRSHRRWAPVVGAAAVIALIGVVVFALQRDQRDSLRPGDQPDSTQSASTTLDATSTTATTTSVTTTNVSTTTPGGTVAPVVTSGGGSTSTAPATVPPTAPTSIAPTTTPTTSPASQPVPPASFDLAVRRLGDRLVFTWPAYDGEGGQRYVLVRVGAQGLNKWPPAPAQVVATVVRIEATSTSVKLPVTDRGQWVLAVLGENRRLLAVSTPVGL